LREDLQCLATMHDRTLNGVDHTARHRHVRAYLHSAIMPRRARPTGRRSCLACRLKGRRPRPAIIPRMRRYSLLVILALLVPRPAHAWGFEAHKFIMDRAIALLPAGLR